MKTYNVYDIFDRRFLGSVKACSEAQAKVMYCENYGYRTNLLVVRS